MDDQQYTADAIRVLQEVAQASGGPLSAEEQTVLASRNGVVIGRYAQTVIKGRWADAERLLLKYAGSISLVQYAEKVIKGRWPEAEKRIISDSRKTRWILRYARKCVKGRWQEAEQRLLAGANLKQLITYARHAGLAAWPELEKRILAEQDLDQAVAYAVLVLGGRWSMAEKQISGCPEAALDYARFVVQGRWPEAEPCLLEDIYVAFTYAEQVIQGRWPEAEDGFAGSDLAELCACEMLPGHWDEEVAKKCPCWLFFYAKDVIGGRLPDELHNLMLVEAIKNPDDPWVKKSISGRRNTSGPGSLADPQI